MAFVFGVISFSKASISGKAKPVSIPEIGENLIDTLGKPTPAFNVLFDAVEHTQVIYNTEDKLFKWIYEKTA